MIKSLLCPSRGVPVEDFFISSLQERVLEFLEAAGIPTETNDRIVELIAAAEREIIVTHNGNSLSQGTHG